MDSIKLVKKMQAPDLTLLSPEEAGETALLLTAKQLAVQLPHLSAEQLQGVFRYLTPHNDQHWSSKVRAFLENLTQRHQLESIGRAASPIQMSEFFEQCLDGNGSLRERLQFVLVGLPQSSFDRVLREIKEPHLQVLKDLGTTESVQHHLTLFIHEKTHEGESYAGNLENLETLVQTYDVRTVRQEDIDHMLGQLEEASNFYSGGMETLNKALALAWNSNRPDLIDRLTQLKEHWLRFLQYAIGKPGSSSNSATALYARLEAKLNTIYGDKQSPTDGQGLIDSDLAIEALATLSLWVPEDYWEIGLLPGIRQADQLDLDPTLHTAKERALFRERLNIIAQENLIAIGLGTVGDLKKAHIYSKEMLMRYINHHRELLASLKPPP